ncbi:HU family DNA-binding protein [Sphingomonas sp. MMS24-JH45]
MTDAGTLTRADLAELLHKRIGLSRADSSRSWSRSWARCATRCPRAKKNVKISGFGTFVLRDKGERVGATPKTGVEVPIAPRPASSPSCASLMMR